ncbi:hypothetical protein BD311DRAFT_776596 [Dichomitus squalens]|uniref:Uncharacterized protein n=1 Tax=Dichomitus squalens TaxID=114155 RepID=A0A4Q9MWH2_9APHY|nr:hypothetical protein BD311DRAFT_776596 [Dichomitus squalens]
MLTVAVVRFDACHSGQQRPSSLFTRAAHLFTGVARKPGCTRDEYLSVFTAASCNGVASSAECCLEMSPTCPPMRDATTGDGQGKECAAVSGLEATTFRRVRTRTRTRTRIAGHLHQTSTAVICSWGWGVVSYIRQTAFPSPTLSPQFEVSLFFFISSHGGPAHGVPRIRAHLKTSPYPRIRRNLPSIQDAAPRYGRLLRRSMDVPGAGLFVALGTSTAVAGS